MNHKNVGLASLIVILVGGLYLIWAFFLDGQLLNLPLIIHGQPQTLKSEYLPGETVYLRVDYCKNRQLDATLQCTLVDDYETFFSPRQTSNPVGCRISTVPIATLPDNVHAGVYHFECQATYHINGFNQAVVPWRTNDFNVVI